MTDLQAKDLCLQYIWAHRVRVALPGGQTFVMTSEPVSAKVKKLTAVWTTDDSPGTRIEVTAAENAEILLIRCLEDAIRGHL